MPESPEKYSKEVTTLIRDFICDGKINQIDRNVCCKDIRGVWVW